MRESVPPSARVREMFLPLRHPDGAVPTVTHYRTTGLVSCLRILDARGLRPRYDESLAPSDRAFIAELLPAQWLDARLALAHFRAIDSLGLSAAELLELGVAAGEKVIAYQTGTLFRMTREAGLSPWTVFPHGQRIWDRMCKGGDLSIERLGPKDVLVTLHGLRMTSSTYFRTMMRGVLQSGLSLWCTRCYVTEVPTGATTLSFREAWV